MICVKCGSFIIIIFKSYITREGKTLKGHADLKGSPLHGKVFADYVMSMEGNSFHCSKSILEQSEIA